MKQYWKSIIALKFLQQVLHTLAKKHESSERFVWKAAMLPLPQGAEHCELTEESSGTVPLQGGTHEQVWLHSGQVWHVW